MLPWISSCFNTKKCEKIGNARTEEICVSIDPETGVPTETVSWVQDSSVHYEKVEDRA